jgi:2,3-bisphosphoglycerate-dependent phosphoglycerate mutase
MPLEALGYVAFGLTSGGISDLKQDDFYHNRRIAKLNDVTHLAAA